MNIRGNSNEEGERRNNTIPDMVAGLGDYKHIVSNNLDFTKDLRDSDINDFLQMAGADDRCNTFF